MYRFKEHQQHKQQRGWVQQQLLPTRGVAACVESYGPQVTADENTSSPSHHTPAPEPIITTLYCALQLTPWVAVQPYEEQAQQQRRVIPFKIYVRVPWVLDRYQRLYPLHAHILDTLYPETPRILDPLLCIRGAHTALRNSWFLWVTNDSQEL